MMKIKNEANIIYWEPSLITRVGLKSDVKLQFQVTASGALKQKTYSSQGALFALGILFSFNGHVKK